MNQKTKQLSTRVRKLIFYKIWEIPDGIKVETSQIQKEECEYMKLKATSRAHEKEKICRTQKDRKTEIFRVLSNRVETSFFPKNRNGAHDGAHSGFLQRNTLSQETLKQRIYAVCAGRSDGT